MRPGWQCPMISRRPNFTQCTRAHGYGEDIVQRRRDRCHSTGKSEEYVLQTFIERAITGGCVTDRSMFGKAESPPVDMALRKLTHFKWRISNV